MKLPKCIIPIVTSLAGLLLTQCGGDAPPPPDHSQRSQQPPPQPSAPTLAEKVAESQEVARLRAELAQAQAAQAELLAAQDSKSKEATYSATPYTSAQPAPQAPSEVAQLQAELERLKQEKASREATAAAQQAKAAEQAQIAALQAEIAALRNQVNAPAPRPQIQVAPAPSVQPQPAYQPRGIQGQPQNVGDVSYFYEPLARLGQWLRSPQFGNLFAPSQGRDPNWHPYSNGRWVQTDVGPTWNSAEPHGWATTHYGRWARDPQNGWLWFPDTEWSPGWVSWRKNDNWVGWAPLPPNSCGQHSFQSDVDQRLRIPADSYVFLPKNHLQQPNYAPHLARNPQQLNGLIRGSQNITKIQQIAGFIRHLGLDEKLRQNGLNLQSLPLQFGTYPAQGRYGSQVNQRSYSYSQPEILAGPPLPPARQQRQQPDVVRDLLAPLLQKHLGGGNVRRDPRSGGIRIELGR